METSVFRSTLTQKLSQSRMLFGVQSFYPAMFEITGVIPGPILS